MGARIALVIGSLQVGGAELMLARLAVALAARGASPTVIGLSQEGALIDRLATANIDVLPLAARPGLLGVATTAALGRALRRLRPDIVHTWLYKADLLGLIAARLAGIDRVIWDIRCSVVGPGDDTASVRVRPLLAALSGVPRAVVANSQAGKIAHEGYGYHPRRWEVIPNGIDVSRFSPTKRDRVRLQQELQIAPTLPVAVCLARFHPLKGHDTLLRALPAIWAQRPEAHVVLAGAQVTSATPVFARALEQSGGRLHLLGERTDVDYLLASADVSILPSSSEGFPNVVAESMAAGTPCVVTRVGDAETIVGATGITVSPGDAQGIASSAVELLTEAEAARIARRAAARERIETNYALDLAANRYLALYESLMRR